MMNKTFLKVISAGTMALLAVGLIACGKKAEAVITTEGEEITQPQKEYETLPASQERKFDYSDLTVGNIKYLMTEQEVVSELGEPVTSYSANEKNTAEGVIKEKVYSYNELTLIFSEIKGKYVLTAAASVGESDVFSRNLRVGDSFDKILEKYYRDTDCMNNIYYSEDKTTIIGKMLYGSFTMDALETVKTKESVEYGVINFNGYASMEAAESYIVEFTCFELPYKDAAASINDDFAQIAFDIDNEGVITAIRWYYYPEEE